MAPDTPLRIVCLCAAWCDVCRVYRLTFDAVQAAGDQGVRFDWIDIEDDAELLDDVDIENFPTVLILRGDQTLFFGVITPQPGTLSRLVQTAAEGNLAPVDATPPVAALTRRLAVSDR